jgi:hypothetical protein
METFNFSCADPENPTKRDIFAGLLLLMSAAKKNYQESSNGENWEGRDYNSSQETYGRDDE